MVDSITKSSNLDTLLIQTSLPSSSPSLLYYASFYDQASLVSYSGFCTNKLLLSDYQDPSNTLLNVAPELTNLLLDYSSLYLFMASVNGSAAAVFDLYLNNLNFFFGEGCVFFSLYFLYIFFIVYIFTAPLVLSWHTFYGAHFLRFFLYFFSLSKETRIQFEAVTQTMIFFIVY